MADLSNLLHEFRSTGEESRIRGYLASISNVKLNELKDAKENCLKLRQMVDLGGRDYDYLHRRLRSTQSSASELRQTVEECQLEIAALKVELDAKEMELVQ